MASKTADRTRDSQPLRDARCYPRFRAQLPAQLTLPAGDTLTVSTRMISMVGLELNCEQVATLQVLARDSDKPAAQRRVLHFSIDLPGEPPVALTGSATLVNSRRLAQNRYALAINYLHLAESDREKLAGFLEECTPV
ncbi:MAG: hypothetical protein VW985_11455 [Gammaproteobacteria bacterium]